MDREEGKTQHPNESKLDKAVNWIRRRASNLKGRKPEKEIQETKRAEVDPRPIRSGNSLPAQQPVIAPADVEPTSEHNEETLVKEYEASCENISLPWNALGKEVPVKRETLVKQSYSAPSFREATSGLEGGTVEREIPRTKSPPPGDINDTSDLQFCTPPSTPPTIQKSFAASAGSGINMVGKNTNVHVNIYNYNAPRSVVGDFRGSGQNMDFERRGDVENEYSPDQMNFQSMSTSLDDAERVSHSSYMPSSQFFPNPPSRQYSPDQNSSPLPYPINVSETPIPQPGQRFEAGPQSIGHDSYHQADPSPRGIGSCVDVREPHAHVTMEGQRQRGSDLPARNLVEDTGPSQNQGFRASSRRQEDVQGAGLALQTTRSRSPSDTKEQGEEVMRFLLVGRTGSGKSSSGNTILGKKAFKIGGGFQSQTAEFKLERASSRKGRSFEIVDTPGLYDTKKSQIDVAETLIQAVISLHPGPHAVIFVIQFGRFTEEEYNAFKRVVAYLGELVLKYVLVLFTRGDEMEECGITIEDSVATGPDNLRSILKDISYRYVVFNNKAPAEYRQSQVDALLGKVSLMLVENGGSHFENEWSSRISQKINKEIAKRVKKAEQNELEHKEHVQKLLKEKKEIEQKLKKQEMEIQTLEKAKALAEDEASRKHEESRRKKAELDKLRYQMEQADKDAKQKSAESQWLQEEISRLTRDNKELKAKSNEIHGQAATMRKELSDLMEKKKKAEENAEISRQESTRKQVEIAALNSKTQLSEQESRRKQEKILELETLRKKAENEARRLNEHAEGMQLLIQNLQFEIKKAQDDRDKKVKEFSDTQARIKELADQNKKLQEEATQKKKESNHAKTEITTLKTDLRIAREAADRKQNEADIKAKALEKKKKEAEQKVDDMKKEKDEVVQEAIRASEEAKNKDPRLREIADVIQQARQDPKVWGEQAWEVKKDMSKGRDSELGWKMLSWAMTNFFAVFSQNGSLCCRNCKRIVGDKTNLVTRRPDDNMPPLKDRLDNEVFPGLQVLVQWFQNPHGYVFEVIMLSTADVNAYERSYAEHTWFPGFKWTIVTCPGCQQHLGWRFHPNRDAEGCSGTGEEEEINPAETFYGLILSRFRPE